jgi:hypothetical protein
MNRRPNPAPRDDHGDVPELVDIAKLRDYVGFVLRAVRRHPFVAAGAFLGMIGLTLGGLAVATRTYHVEAELLAQRQLMMAALGNPSRSVPGEADAPTRAAAETVRRRDNLVSLVKQTGLLDRYEQTRAPATRAKDAVVRAFTGPLTEEERLDLLVEFLQKRLYVFSGEGTVTIAIDWPDPQMAYQLVDTAQQNFLEARHASELSSIAESISILERHAAGVRESIDVAMDEVKHASTRPTKPEPAPRREPVITRVQPSSEGVSTEGQQVKVMLEGKRRAIRDLEDYRRRHLAELQTELGQQRQVFADAHPTVVRLQQSIASLNEDSPQLAALRKEERELAEEWARLGGASAGDKGGEDREFRPAAVLPQARRLLDGEGTAEQYAKSRLRFAIQEYESLVQRIDAARIELDTARAAFKYRYSVIRPAQFPKTAITPKIPKVLAVGTLAALLAAFAAAAFLDWRRGRIVERWQVERMVGVPFLGQMERS